MKLPVFISWSGERSREVAKALGDWLPEVLQATDPWLSTKIKAGKSWWTEIGDRLAKSNFGIICVTAENKAEPWLNFEAGACAKLLKESSCCPYLLGLEPTDLEQPLGGFQAKRANKDGTWELVKDVNSAMTENALPEPALKRVFDRAWKDLQRKLGKIPPPKKHGESERSVEDMVREILDIVRGGEEFGPAPKPDPQTLDLFEQLKKSLSDVGAKPVQDPFIAALSNRPRLGDVFGKGVMGPPPSLPGVGLGPGDPLFGRKKKRN